MFPCCTVLEEHILVVTCRFGVKPTHILEILYPFDLANSDCWSHILFSAATVCMQWRLLVLSSFSYCIVLNSHQKERNVTATQNFFSHLKEKSEPTVSNATLVNTHRSVLITLEISELHSLTSLSIPCPHPSGLLTNYWLSFHATGYNLKWICIYSC